MLINQTHPKQAGRWHRSEQGIVLDLGPSAPWQPQSEVAETQPWLSEARPEEEFYVSQPVVITLEWRGPYEMQVRRCMVQGRALPRIRGVYAIYNSLNPVNPTSPANPANILRYIGLSGQIDTRFTNSRYRVLRELGVPDFNFTVYLATATGPSDLHVVDKRLNPVDAARAATVLAEYALLRNRLPPGNLKIPEPVFRNDTTPTRDVTLTIRSTNDPPPMLLREKTINLLRKP
jgi:hypothetical protein